MTSFCVCVLIFRGHQAEVWRATRGAAAGGTGEGSTGLGSESGWKQRSLLHEHLCGRHQPRRTSQLRWTHPSGRPVTGGEHIHTAGINL